MIITLLQTFYCTQKQQQNKLLIILKWNIKIFLEYFNSVASEWLLNNASKKTSIVVTYKCTRIDMGLKENQSKPNSMPKDYQMVLNWVALNFCTLCPWCFPYSLHTQHMSGPGWQPSSRHTNSMACTWCCGQSIFSWGLSARGTRRCLASVRVECVSWEHSAHRCVAHTVQYMEAVWVSSSSQRITH